MGELPSDLLLRILSMLDHRHLASAARVCRSWNSLSRQAHLWQRLYEQRWGEGTSIFSKLKSWEAAYEAQDRCERIGRDVCITREGLDYILVHEGRLLRLLGSRKMEKEGPNDDVCEKKPMRMETSLTSQCKPSGSREGLVNDLLFFLGDLECATRNPKRIRVG
ncbi:hypothetical protein GOP47_0004013 [Adiantum capillus-veneris]|uniref:F-box domain-containing protein n=1 Tax=Adiantum capillus-veneris TaxID=13818 RepID=A0A9D4ZPZ2_ADICA|nr:hypothetical protein GOP47_0004013 [Adiantum capillus-veneris]